MIGFMLTIYVDNVNFVSYVNNVKTWFPAEQSHLSPWATKFDCLKLIAQSLSPEHFHQFPTFSAKLITFYKIDCFQA